MSTSGLILGPLQNLRDLIAASATFQSWTGADGAANPTAVLAAARLHSYLVFPPPDQDAETYDKDQLEVARPFAVVDWFANRGGSGGGAMDATLEGNGLFLASNRLFVTFEADTPAEMLKQDEEPLVWFTEKVEAVISEMLALSQGSGAYLIISHPQLFTPPFRSARTDAEGIGDYWRTTLTIETAEFPV